jgi:hypothetical protein
MTLYSRRLISIFCTLALMSAAFRALAQSASLSSIVRQASGQTQVTVTGISAAPLALQASSDLKTWSNLQTLTLTGAPIVYTDSQPNAARRFYRLHAAGTGAALPDLGNLPNAVFPAPEGFDTIQFAPNGKLGFIVWRNQDLIIRERTTAGDWSEQIVTSGGGVFQMGTFTFSGLREDYKFQPSAILFYDSSSQPHVFKVNGTAIAHFIRNGSGNWLQQENITDTTANAPLTVLVGAIGPNNVFHFAVLGSGDSQNLTYGSNVNGQWSWTTISNIRQTPLFYWAPPFAPRWLSLAVDSANHPHLTYREGLDITYDTAGHPRAYSELRYASNISGQWTSTVVMKPADVSGEADNGASIAIAPDGKPRIVSWYDERADTGSAQESRMYFHQQDANGNWFNSVVISGPDGYIAGDGPKGSGFSPYLRYDSRGTPHILFLDHAGEHFSGIGQQEYAGNLRHAWWNGAQWQFETIYRQTDVLHQEIIYPAFALNGNEMAVTLLERNTQWNLTAYPPLSNSTYSFRFFTKGI